MNILVLNGFCPMGCGQKLYYNHQEIVCGGDNCPDPFSVSEILSDPETEHIVRLYEDNFSVKHPLRERLNDELLNCEVGQHVADFGELQPLGTYRVINEAQHPRWEKIDE